MINFNANSGGLAAHNFINLSFTSVSISNAQSNDKDAVTIKANATNKVNLGNLASDSETLDLEAVTRVAPINNFVLYNSDAQGTNKWSVDSVGISYDFSKKADDPRAVTVDVFAQKNHHYGTDTVATFISAVQTAPDGFATYQIAFDVTPSAGGEIMSGISGGETTRASWGVGNASDGVTTDDLVINGSLNDAVDNIDNIRVINFNANNGDLVVTDFNDLSFVGVTIVNGQSLNKDAIGVTANGGTPVDLGNLATNPQTLDLETITTTAPITNFALQPTNTQATNKWSVAGITVRVLVNEVRASGERADWLRGAWGLNWKPVGWYGYLETDVLNIDAFLAQISGLKTLDYIQLHLNTSYRGSPMHLGPNALLESLWQGDLNANGKPRNLVVPRISSGIDQFLPALQAVKAAGLKTQVYLNSSQLLLRWKGVEGAYYQEPVHGSYPDVIDRWKNWCDTDVNAVAFINSQSYHTSSDPDFSERKYMFCYAEFVLKDYAILYGDLIDAWIFDSGKYMYRHGGDNLNDINDQKIYRAWTEAVRIGNPDVAVSFNNGTGSDDLVNNPFPPATLYDDYMFGHPFYSGKDIGDRSNNNYDANYSQVEWMSATGGNVHDNGDANLWDDKVVGHIDPPMGPEQWNKGDYGALTNNEFKRWTLETVRAGGAVSWGVALRSVAASDPDFLAEDWALSQLQLADAHLARLQSPGQPNWARADTVLLDAVIGEPYTNTLTDGVDFWVPEGTAITDLIAVSEDNSPAWLTITEASPGTWILTGIPTESSPTNYSFRLRISDGSANTDRRVELKVQ